MAPSSGESWPRISENSVDLPAPFGPIRPIRFPRFTWSETSENSVLVPKDLVTCEIVSMERVRYTRLKALKVSDGCAAGTAGRNTLKAHTPHLAVARGVSRPTMAHSPGLPNRPITNLPAEMFRPTHCSADCS